MLASCAQQSTPTTTPTTTTTSTPKTTPTTTATGVPKTAPATTTGNWWDIYGTPQYGDMITYEYTLPIPGLLTRILAVRIS